MFPLNLPLYTRCLFRKGFFFFIPVKAKGLMSLPQLVPGYLCRRAAAAGAWARSTQLLGFVPVWGPYSGSGGHSGTSQLGDGSCDVWGALPGLRVGCRGLCANAVPQEVALQEAVPPSEAR